MVMFGCGGGIEGKVRAVRVNGVPGRGVGTDVCAVVDAA